jgi:hypothetical protein
MTPDTYTLRKRLRRAKAFNTLLCWIVLVVAVAVALSLAGCSYTPPRPPEERPGCMPSVSARSNISPWPSTASAPTANRSNPTSPVPVILAGTDRPRRRPPIDPDRGAAIHPARAHTPSYD